MMGFDCGFDIYPRLEASAVNQEIYRKFLNDITNKYKDVYDDQGRQPGGKILDVSSPTYIQFMVGECPRMPKGPKHCNYFLRFSSKVSGRLTAPAEPYIKDVYQLAKLHFGSRVHFWHDMDDFDEEWQEPGRHTWAQVYEADSQLRALIEDQKSRELDLRCRTCAKDELVTTVCGRCGSVRYCSRECQKSDWKIHKPVCQASVVSPVATSGQKKQPLYTLVSIPGKNQGLVASTEIQRGTRIISEAYLFEVNRNVYNLQTVENQVQDAVDRLSKENHEAFFALSNAHGNAGHSIALGIARTNALPLGSNADKGGIFLEASRINHSCSHNAQNTWNSHLGKLTIHAIRNIPKGEEICISYIDGFDDHVARQATLEQFFKFNCTCTLCSLPESLRQQSDARRNKMKELDGSIGDGIRIISTPASCLRDAHELFKLFAEEQIKDASIPRLYYDAFQIAIANGDEARAQVFARLAYEERAMLEGVDSPEVMRLKGLMDIPSSHNLYGSSWKWRQPVSKVPQNLSSQEFEKWLWRQK